MKTPLIWIVLWRGLTVRDVGPTWEVSSRLRGPPLLNSLLGVMTQKPIGFGSLPLIHP